MRRHLRLRRWAKWGGLICSSFTLLAWTVSLGRTWSWVTMSGPPRSASQMLDLSNGCVYVCVEYPLFWPKRVQFIVTRDHECTHWSPSVETRAGRWRIVIVPLWMLFLLIGIPTGVLFWRGRRIAPGRSGCDMTGNSAGICPECGERTLPLMRATDMRSRVRTILCRTGAIGFCAVVLLGGVSWLWYIAAYSTSATHHTLLKLVRATLLVEDYATQGTSSVFCIEWYVDEAGSSRFGLPLRRWMPHYIWWPQGAGRWCLRAELPIWPAAVGFAALWWAARKRRRSAPSHLCVRCGYDLTGNTSGVCPECGEPTGSNSVASATSCLNKQEETERTERT